MATYATGSNSVRISPWLGDAPEVALKDVSVGLDYACGEPSSEFSSANNEIICWGEGPPANDR